MLEPHTLHNMKITNAIFLVLSLLSACDSTPEVPADINPRNEMRAFIIGMSEYAKAQQSSFSIIPQNGEGILSLSEDNSSQPATAYIAAIDGQGREDLWYGYDRDDKATDAVDRDQILPYLQLAENNGVEVMVTDYCSSQTKMADSYEQNTQQGFVSFAADDRELQGIPAFPDKPSNENSDNIEQLSDAQNFLYLINPGAYSSKEAFLIALESSRYDLILIDAFYDDTWLTVDDVDRISTKPQGGNRLVISYMSIGEAEDYRFYWQTDWKNTPPSWLAGENSQWKGNYKVRYWEAAWQDIIFGNQEAYLDKILELGFDGVYLDIVDAYEYFE